MRFVDTHCHLNFDVFKENVAQIIERAREVGIEKIVVPGIDVETSRIAVELASKYDDVYAAVGIHPNEANKFEQQHINVLEGFLKEPKIVAIGEIGLDFHYHPENEVKQIDLLEVMLGLATDHHKPVILHSRKSIETLLDMIKHWHKKQQKDENQFYGVFHGFEGNSVQGIAIRSMDMAIGVGGPITFNNALDKHVMVKELGIQNVVLETDSPLLSPHPFRGQTNEPFRIPVIAEKVANILEITMEQVSKITGQNAQYLFRWDEIN